EATAVDLALLAKGFYIVAAPVTSQAGAVREQWDTIWLRLTGLGFSPKPAMEGEGTGVGEAYSWAIHNPEKVSCIYGENPVMRSLMSKGTVMDSLAPLAKAGVPLLHVCGGLDPWLASNTRVAEKKYKELGGKINVIIHEGEGHFPTGPRDPKPVVDFITASVRATSSAPARAAATHAPTPMLHGGPPLPLPAPAAPVPPTPAAPARDYHFDRTISREVLENYLSRAISMEGLLNGRGDLDDNIRMLRSTGAKFIGRSICLWGGEANLLNNFERARQQAPKVHAADPDMILEACIFEIVSSQVDQVPVPDWAFTALGLPVEKRNFRYEDMLYADGRRKDQWGKGASVPDVSRMETRLWFYFLAASYIDLGFEAIHYGQVELMNGNDPDLTIWAGVFSLARSYAATHARRHMLLCDAHTPGGGFLKDGKLLLDFHAFPLRIMEVPDKPQEAILKLGFSDGLYKRSKGGVTFSGWSCEHLPYLVELDNYGASNAPGQPGQSKGGFDWIWGYDEITWFAHQTKQYRADWLRYAQDWVQKTDPNGHLEMPGSRTERSPIDKRRWYYANTPGPAVPDGLGDEEAIRAIWEEDAKGPGQHVKEGRSAGTAAHLHIRAPGTEGQKPDAGGPTGDLQGQTGVAPGQLQAGTAKVNITPEGDEPLHDSVYARSLVLDLGGKRMAFVSVDLAIFTSERVGRVCKEKYGIAQLMLCSSHNHSEPQKKGRSFEKGNPYTVFYEDQIIKAVGIAVANMFPARIAAGHRTFPQLGFNRLVPREDGHARESWFGDDHYVSENPERIPFGPVDPEVGVIRIEDMQGQPRIILMNYACHADIVCFNYAISADYPGVACRKVEEAFGNKLNCLFIQGAGGNIESLLISSRRTGPDDPFKTDYAPMERMGELLAWETVKLAKTLSPAAAEKTEISIMDDSLQFSGRFDKTVHYNVHISTILINKDIVIAACPGELFIQLQLDWKKKMEAVAAHAFLFGYTWSGGRWPGYVADIRSAALGGYGADQDPGIIEVGAGESMMNRQLENYYRLTGLMREKPGPVGFKPGPRWIITPVQR
ncbi:MAG TPA: hypothetical protein VK563_18940, partial [Puia sp.]|nr:hypothetical protein [Puia sp.]